MMNPFLKETLTNWVTEYCESDLCKKFSKEVQSGGAFLLQEFLIQVVEESGELESVGEKVVGGKMMSLANRYQLSAEVLENLPVYIGDFFEDLEVRGRLAGGRLLGKFVRTFKGRLEHKTMRRPGSKIGRNDPCPCGSGLKFKKCCMGSF